MLARYSFQSPQLSHFFVRGGLILGVLQDLEISWSDLSSVNANLLNTNGGTSTSGKDHFNNTDLRAALGVGGVLKFTKNIAWTVQADYQLGTTKINTNKLASELDFYNSSLGISTGLSINL